MFVISINLIIHSRAYVMTIVRYNISTQATLVVNDPIPAVRIHFSAQKRHDFDLYELNISQSIE